jgi:hypothetical protein
VSRDVRDRPRGRDSAHAGALALAVAIVAGVLSGCGGGGDDTASSPATSNTTTPQGTTSGPANATTGGNEGGQHGRLLTAKLRTRLAVLAVLTSGDPGDACGRFVTKHYLRVAYGGRQGCVQAQAPGSTADQLHLKDFRLNGDRAIAVVVPSGGPYNGERVTVSLVHDGSHWAVDALEANVPVGP